ncbi:MAG TPA: glycosyltransferase family 1 protein [Blastocatellia bacterium]|nr:glycosyltransferase family 1 protein [Blastocatellia bacterium]
MKKNAAGSRGAESDYSSLRPGQSGQQAGHSSLTTPILSSYSESVIPVSQGLPDIVCLSHLRWDFVYQRPQHLLSRCARERRVFFIEEPLYDATAPSLDLRQHESGVCVVVPHLPQGLNEAENAAIEQSLLIDELFLERAITDYILWYYTPMALSFTRHLEPLAIVYDCMDELSAFKNAPPELRQREAELLERADLVFTGGYSLYEAKCNRHPNVHPFPSSIDGPHFRRARREMKEPADQADIPHPRLGYCGVIDERMDKELIAGIAEARPDWQIVMLGPVVKIDPAELPRRANIHYLGGKSYQELPTYLAGWDIALLPFAHNESTRYISPTKTPEYLAAGVPPISTSIRDVVHPWGQQGLVKIADTTQEFVAAAEYLMSPEFNYNAWLRQVDEVLAFNSWDRTWARMMHLVNLTVRNRYPDLVLSEAHPPASVSSSNLSVSVSPITGD